MGKCYDNYTEVSSLELVGISSNPSDVSICRDDSPNSIVTLSSFWNDNGKSKSAYTWRYYKKDYTAMNCAEPHRITNDVSFRLTSQSRRNYKLCIGEYSNYSLVLQGQDCPLAASEVTAECAQ